MKIVALVPKALGIGFRLSGVETYSPDQEKLPAILQKLNSDPEIGLVIISKSFEQNANAIDKPTIVIEDMQNA